MKKTLTATVDTEFLEWIKAEVSRKDEFGRPLYRNKSQLVEELIILGKKTLEELEKKREHAEKKETK